MLICTAIIGSYAYFDRSQEHYNFWLHTTLWFVLLGVVDRIIRWRILHESDSPVEDARDIAP
jgi:hypothetical protein